MSASSGSSPGVRGHGGPVRAGLPAALPRRRGDRAVLLTSSTSDDRARGRGSLPGKKISDSLLSGGERAPVAVALLVAIFKARPSPFYIMDEVEAALDEPTWAVSSLLFVEPARQLYLIDITHQKKMMEIADAPLRREHAGRRRDDGNRAAPADVATQQSA